MDFLGQFGDNCPYFGSSSMCVFSKETNKAYARWPSLVGWLVFCLVVCRVGQSPYTHPSLLHSRLLLLFKKKKAEKERKGGRGEGGRGEGREKERTRGMLSMHVHGEESTRHTKRKTFFFSSLTALFKLSEGQRLVCSTLWRNNPKGRTLRPLTADLPSHSPILLNSIR